VGDWYKNKFQYEFRRIRFRFTIELENREIHRQTGIVGLER
jgi:hypothetical protein